HAGMGGRAEGYAGQYRGGARGRSCGIAQPGFAAGPRMSARGAAIAAAFVAACRDELEAPKPGNVHVFADGHRMSVADFLRSADAAAGPLSETGARVGARILGAVTATRALVGTNTN